MPTQEKETPQTNPKDSLMSDAEYSRTKVQLIVCIQTVSRMDLDGFLDRIRECETLGPILEPTLYRAGADRLAEVRRAAEALRRFQAEVSDLNWSCEAPGYDPENRETANQALEEGSRSR